MGNGNLYMMAVLLDKRSAEAPEVQKIFTKYGDCILSRLGVHECEDSNGLISLNIRSSEDNITRFEGELKAIYGVNAKHMMVE